jgi:hypothetical protein
VPEPVATCDDVAAHLRTLDAPEGAEGDPAARAREACVSAPWPAELIACVSSASSWDVATACFPADPNCATLVAMIEAGRDGKFASLRGEPDDVDDPSEYASTLQLLDAPCTITADSPDEGFASEMQCEVFRTQKSEDIQTVSGEVGAMIAGCLPTWTVNQGQTSVEFVEPSDDGDGQIQMWAGTLNGGISYIQVDIVGTFAGW